MHPSGGYSWLDTAYSWNKQPTHTPFPKKINTPITTLRFIGFVAKISVLTPKLPADGQWPKETKESVTFFIWSPLIYLYYRLRLKNRTELFFYYLFFFFYSIYIYILFVYFLFSNQVKEYSNYKLRTALFVTTLPQNGFPWTTTDGKDESELVC